MFGRTERQAFGAAKSNAEINIPHFNDEVSGFDIFVFIAGGVDFV